MCGITGVISNKPLHLAVDLLQSATNTLLHRGPESEGYWQNDAGNIAFGHRRLAIIDLGKDGAQPMHYAGRYTIIYNGEIYNYLEIKKDLQQHGYAFASSSDTEVVLAAFAHYGEKCLSLFDGMFAFAIWDEKEQTLFAARDRFGEKPFFFHYDGEVLLFASEMKALWKLGVKKEVNNSMLYNFLSISYTTNPSDPLETFFSTVQKLPAAHFLKYYSNSNQLHTERYWDIETGINQNISEAEAIHHFKELLSESTRLRLRSDVSIGTSLSGGLDSSAIVAYCNDNISSQYSHKCFTASFEGFEKDETKYAALVARQFGLQHFTTTVHEEEVVALMAEVMKQQEEPFSSGSVLAQYKVFGLAKQQGVTVLLDGQGADEIMGGYHKYYRWYWQELYKRNRLKESGELKAAHAIGVNEDFTIKHKIAALAPEFTTALLQSRKAKLAYRDAALHPDFRFSNRRNLYYATPATYDLNGVLYYNTVVNGLEELLRLADRNSMAHSVEVRLPFLHHKLVEFLFTLPSSFKIHEGWSKFLLRKAVDKKLPDEITWRKGKVGFEPPQEKWMMMPAVQDAIATGKKKLVEAGILDRREIDKKIQPHHGYAADNREWKYWSASYLFT